MRTDLSDRTSVEFPTAIPLGVGGENQTGAGAAGARLLRQQRGRISGSVVGASDAGALPSPVAGLAAFEAGVAVDGVGGP